MKLTNWYRGDQKPMSDRVGPYKRQYSGMELYCWWSGKLFGLGFDSPELCKKYKNSRSGYSLSQSLPWRGLAEAGE